MSTGRCLIYFIGAGGFVKIGKSTTSALYKRLSQIQIGCPFHAELLATLEVDPVFESVIHRGLIASHERGEWFRRTPEVEAFISRVRDVEGSAGDGWRSVIASLPQAPPPIKSDPVPIVRRPHPRYFRLTPRWVIERRRCSEAASTERTSFGEKGGDR